MKKNRKKKAMVTKPRLLSAKVTKVHPVVLPNIKIEVELGYDEALRVKNWLGLLRDKPYKYGRLSPGLENLLAALEYEVE